jgi:hypothetical protein
MFQFLFSLFWKKSDDARKAQEEKDKPLQSASGYVYTDYKAKMREAERKKKAEQNR